MRKSLPAAACLALGLAPAAIFLAIPAVAAPGPAPAVPRCTTVQVSPLHGGGSHPFRVCGGMVRQPPPRGHWACHLTKGTVGKTGAAMFCRAWTDSP